MSRFWKHRYRRATSTTWLLQKSDAFWRGTVWPSWESSRGGAHGKNGTEGPSAEGEGPIGGNKIDCCRWQGKASEICGKKEKEVTPRPRVPIKEAFYIKLGAGGKWEEECLSEGTLRLGYSNIPHEICLVGDWEAVKAAAIETSGRDRGSAARDANQIRAFYEAESSSVFVTIANGNLYWCRPSGPVEALADGTRRRSTIDGWHSKSIGGAPLTKDRLSGNLIKMEAYRGTICRVKEIDYLIQKIGDELSSVAIEADRAENAVLASIVSMVRQLTWRDFEQLVDLVFSSSGWRRTSRVGGVQKTVDMEVILPSTNERAFVQVKSHATTSSLRDYVERFRVAVDYDRMFFVWHSGDVDLSAGADGVTLIGPDEIARLVLDAGAWSWLRHKAC